MMLDDANDIFARVVREKHEHIEKYACAYAKATDLPPQQVSLEIKQDSDPITGTIKTSYRFKPTEICELFVLLGCRGGSHWPIAILPGGTSRQVAERQRERYEREKSFEEVILASTTYLGPLGDLLRKENSYGA